MSNEREIISEYFEAKGVSRGEFEALKRFGDYQELTNGTLMRMEGNKEFRIYCEDVEGCPLGVVTEGVLSLLSGEFDEACPRDHAIMSRSGFAHSSAASAKNR